MLTYPWCECTECRANTNLRQRLKPHYDNIRANDSGVWPEFEDTQLMILEPQIPGYLLNRKCWARLLSNNVQLTSEGISTTALSNLCLPDDGDTINTKHLIYALVHNHGKKEAIKSPDIPDLLQDFVEGKG